MNQISQLLEVILEKTREDKIIWDIPDKFSRTYGIIQKKFSFDTPKNTFGKFEIELRIHITFQKPSPSFGDDRYIKNIEEMRETDPKYQVTFYFPETNKNYSQKQGEEIGIKTILDNLYKNYNFDKFGYLLIYGLRDKKYFYYHLNLYFDFDEYTKDNFKKLIYIMS